MDYLPLVWELIKQGNTHYIVVITERDNNRDEELQMRIVISSNLLEWRV
jgi:hypothetical protein